MASIGGTFNKAVWGTLAFTGLMAVLMFSFAMLFNAVFCTALPQYGTLVDSMRTVVIDGIMGAIDADQLDQANPNIGSLIYALYLTVVLFTGFTIMIAIIADACKPPRPAHPARRQPFLGVHSRTNLTPFLSHCLVTDEDAKVEEVEAGLVKSLLDYSYRKLDLGTEPATPPPPPQEEAPPTAAEASRSPDSVAAEQIAALTACVERLEFRLSRMDAFLRETHKAPPVTPNYRNEAPPLISPKEKEKSESPRSGISGIRGKGGKFLGGKGGKAGLSYEGRSPPGSPRTQGGPNGTLQDIVL